MLMSCLYLPLLSCYVLLKNTNIETSLTEMVSRKILSYSNEYTRSNIKKKQSFSKIRNYITFMLYFNLVTFFTYAVSMIINFGETNLVSLGDTSKPSLLVSLCDAPKP